MHLKKFTKAVHIKFPTSNTKETRILNINKSSMNKTIAYLCMTNFHDIYYLFLLLLYLGPQGSIALFVKILISDPHMIYPLEKFRFEVPPSPEIVPL